MTWKPEFQEGHECVHCRKKLKNKYVLVRCIRLMLQPHGKDCDCFLPVGTTCINKPILLHHNPKEIILVKKEE